MSIKIQPSRLSFQRAISTAAIAAFALLSACGSSGSSGDTTTLKVADYLPTSDYHIKQGLDVFMKEAEKQSDGSLEFDHYPSEQLAKADDLLDATGSGVADISLIGVTYTTDKLPLAGVCTLPGGFTSVEEGTKACWKVTQTPTISKEYSDNGVQPIYAHVNEGYGLQTKEKKVQSLEDMKGLKIRSGAGTMSTFISRTGATPVEMSGPETYEGLERGTIDGALYPALSLKPYDLTEVLKYGIDNVSLGSFAHAAVINEGVWDDLSSAQQDALKTAGEKAMDTYATWVDTNQEKVVDNLEKEGTMQFYGLPGSEVKRWNKLADEVSRDWAKSRDKDGFNGTEVYKDWNDALNQ